MDDNVYQPPGTRTDVSPAGDIAFGRFDLSRAFTLGWEGFQRNMGTSIGVIIVVMLASAAALVILPLVGYLLIAPHLIMLGVPLAGLYAVRGRLEFSHAFLGFQQYGRILGAGLLLFMVLMAMGLLFSAPTYYFTFKNVDFAAKPDQIISLYLAGAQTVPFWATLLGWGGSLVSLYINARIQLFLPLMFEKELSMGEALQASLTATAPDQWLLAVYNFLVGLIAAAGIIACFIGVFFTAGFSMALQGAALHQLLGEDRRGDSA